MSCVYTCIYTYMPWGIERATQIKHMIENKTETTTITTAKYFRETPTEKYVHIATSRSTFETNKKDFFSQLYLKVAKNIWTRIKKFPFWQRWKLGEKAEMIWIGEKEEKLWP